MKKKNLVFSLLIFMILACKKENSSSPSENQTPASFELSGSITTDTIHKLYLINYMDLTHAYDSIEVKNKKFHYSQSLSVPADLIIISNNKNYELGNVNTYLLAEGGKINVSIDADNPRNTQVAGGKLNPIYADYQKKTDRFFSVSDSLYDQMRDRQMKNPNDKLEDLIALQNQNYKAEEKYKMEFATKNKENILSLWSIYEMKDPGMQSTLWEKLPSTLKKSTFAQSFQKAIEYEKKRTYLPKTLPQVTLIGLDGKTLPMQSLKGHYYFIDFWASWCLPCREEIPQLKKMYPTYKDKNIEFISISLDENPSAWKKAVEKDKPTWAQYTISKQDDEIVSSYWSIQAIPYGILISPTGETIEKQIINASELKEILDKQLK